MKTITAADLANTKIRVTPEQSAKVQELAGKLGYKWNTEHLHAIIFIGEPFLFFANRTIKFGRSIQWNGSTNREITYSDLFPEAEEPITPEALEKEGFEYGDSMGWKKGKVMVSVYADSVMVCAWTIGNYIIAKGTDTMPKLRLLTELINGKQ